MRLVAILCAFNEEKKGNLRRCLSQLRKFADNILVYDDGSTDNSYDLYREYEVSIIRGKTNDFRDELRHKNLLLKEAKKLKADWILIVDADEVISVQGQNGGLRELCRIGDKTEINSWRLRYWNIWRSKTWHRSDYLGDGWFTRLFKCTKNSHFRTGHGLHEDLEPVVEGIAEMADPELASVLHYGYSTKELIEHRWEERTKYGVPKEMRQKCIDESEMKVERIDKKYFPEELWAESDQKPTPIIYSVK